MTEPAIRIYVLDENKVAQDAQDEFELSTFAGQLPAVGDVILHPGVLSDLPRDLPANRRIFTVIRRVLNPRDMENYVVLIVEERQGEEADQGLIG